MNYKYLYLLLKIIKSNGNVKRLTYENLNFKDIADLTNKALLNEIIIFDNDKLILSFHGEKLFEELEIKYSEQNKDQWIVKENESKIEKLEKDFIFLPNQNELNF